MDAVFPACFGVALLALCVSAGACAAVPAGSRRPGARTVADLSQAERDALVHARIYFGHQSVGANIVSGMRSIFREQRLPVTIVDAPAQPPGDGGWILHGPVGRNGDAASKTIAFARAVDDLAGKGLEIALHKFCYLDVTAGTDVRSVLARYEDSLASLRGRHPEVAFVHVTAPLTATPPAWKSWLKRILNRPGDDEADNARRDEFNDLLRQRYRGREPIFDLAMLESTDPAAQGPQGRVETPGRRAPGLLQRYTDDGGHLNEEGKRVVGEALIVLLAEVAASRERL